MTFRANDVLANDSCANDVWANDGCANDVWANVAPV